MLLDALHNPQAHDVLQIADVPHAALVREVARHAFGGRNRGGNLRTEQRPCAGGEERGVLRHRDALDGAGGVVRRAEDDTGLSADFAGDVWRQLPKHRARLRQAREKARRQGQGTQNLRVVLLRRGADQPGRGRVCVLARLHAAKPVQQVFWHHQEVVRLLQTPGFRVLVELINAVEGLKLNARAAVQLGERHMLMHLVNHRLRALVAVGVAGEKRRAVLQQDVIHRPSVDGQAVDVRILRKRCLDARLDVLENALDVPDEMPVFALYPVREAVNLVCLERTVRLDADDVPPG